jgi:hypothetical protein
MCDEGNHHSVQDGLEMTLTELWSPGSPAFPVREEVEAPMARALDELL